MTQGSVQQAVTREYRKEAQGVKYDEDFILKQKYGLVSPQLTGKENNLIRRESRKNGRNG
jgi:hypothetical protein